ncbi:MAG TPA: 3-deoxy-D-manno-octulosonic acid transferase [Rhizomicrobium sp.]|jgi:3-deoxy-D-manno-octulosonic-acid transferase|nr:3-deoxy-D-manno-octulosonic acid transferase [Rhizomicrobium sp.]
MSFTPLTLTFYRYAMLALSPVAPMLLRRRAARGKEDLSRIDERLGKAATPRPDGALIWVHGASVGETVAALPLIDTLLKSGANVLVTSGTVTSAQVMAERLPAGAIHQFAPVDTPAAIKGFLDHWRPDVGLFVDSELWPNMILMVHERGVRLGLINARISERSFKGWQRARKSAARLLGTFDFCLAQDDEIADRLRALGANNVQVAGNLKADAPPLPADPAKLEELRTAVGGRPVFLASSTHSGEEETLLPAHDLLARKYPGLLTIVVPRHPARGGEIAMLCGERANARRSLAQPIETDTQIYVADTIGELGLFYRLAPFAFMGGSLIPHGGQNPLEPARLNCAVMTGPYTANFRTAYDAILSAQGGGRVQTSTEIAALAERFLASPDEAKKWGEAAARGAESLGGAIEKTLNAISQMPAHAGA